MNAIVLALVSHHFLSDALHLCFGVFFLIILYYLRLVFLKGLQLLLHLIIKIVTTATLLGIESLFFVHEVLV